MEYVISYFGVNLLFLLAILVNKNYKIKRLYWYAYPVILFFGLPVILFKYATTRLHAHES